MDSQAAAAADALPEQPPAPAPPLAPFKPIAAAERIEALDVVRGFALLGIFLMNIEVFNRFFGDIFGRGIPPEAQGLDWAATFFVNFFVQGKFWTIFSTLFGMGFAVMLVRAEKAGRPFVQVYLRRILGLAVFGSVHYIFIWDGDILVSYSVAALMLMLVLYGKPRLYLALIGLCVGLGFLAQPFFAMAGGLAVTGLVAVYLRSEKRLRLRWLGVALPIFSFILMLVGTVVSIAAAALWLLPNAPVDPRMPTTVFGPLFFIAGWLSWKYVDPPQKRALRIAVSLYVFGGVVATSFGVLQHFTPDPLVVLTEAAKKEAAQQAAAGPAADRAPLPASAAKAKAEKGKAEKSKAEQAAQMKAQRDRSKAEREADRAKEIQLMKSGSWPELVYQRASKYPEKVAGDFGFGVVLVGMFLIGMWFVRSGAIENSAQHLPLFRRLALVGVPLGVGLSLLSAAIATSHVPGERHDGWGIAGGLHMLGNLPACVGYIALVVLMLHSRGPLSQIRVLAPLGRMALTNYLMQSVICGFYFYGYGLGHFGMGRAAQFLFVAIIYGLQIVFSHWWLSRFRYGPMEWLWRGFTYREVPPLRIAAPAVAETPRAA